jgi:hypothetical protein
MPCDFVFRKEYGFVITRWWGVVMDDDLVGLYEALFSDPAFEPWLQELADARFIERHVSSDAITRLDRLVRRRLPELGVNATPYRTTLIAPSPVTYGLTQAYSSLADGGPRTVLAFRTVAQAARSLELAPEDLERLLADP